MRNLIVVAAALALAPSIALAQSPPAQQTPVAPKTEQLDPNSCAHPGTRATIGQGGDIDVSKQDSRNLSDKLAASNGVICPPGQVDPEIRAPTPPGGDPSVTPK